MCQALEGPDVSGAREAVGTKGGLMSGLFLNADQHGRCAEQGKREPVIRVFATYLCRHALHRRPLCRCLPLSAIHEPRNIVGHSFTLSKGPAFDNSDVLHAGDPAWALPLNDCWHCRDEADQNNPSHPQSFSLIAGQVNAAV